MFGTLTCSSVTIMLGVSVQCSSFQMIFRMRSWSPSLRIVSCPGGLVALYDGRGRSETPIWLPKHRVIVFGDALTERNGELLVWDSRAGHEKRELPALRAMLELPFERVIISHCDNEPVHTRAEFEKALKRPPWKG